MINTNASGIFKQHRLGGSEEAEQEDPSQAYEEQQQRVMDNNGQLNALQPINFNDKIMGGQNAAAFMEGKFAPLDGGFNYAQRVNMLTGKGVSTMEDEINTQNKINSILGESSPMDKVSMMTGGIGGKSGEDKISMLLGNTKNKKDVLSSLLGSGSSGTDKISKMLGTSKTKKENTLNSLLGNTGSGSDKISKILGDRNSKKQKSKDFKFSFDTNTGFGNRAFSGINMLGQKTVGKSKKALNQSKESAMDKIQSSFGLLNNKKFKTNNNFASKINENFKVPVGMNSMHNLLGNPEKIAKRRMKQQKGLPMYGDFDGDKILNAFDCDPLDPKKQGEQHDLSKYIPGPNDGVPVGKPYYADSELVVQGPRDAVRLDENGNPITPEEVDTASADIRMGNSYGQDPNGGFGDFTSGTGYSNSFGETINNTFNNTKADLNNDGTSDAKDKQTFANMGLNEQLNFVSSQMSEGKGNANRYAKLYEELLRAQRYQSEQSFKENKYSDERADKEKTERAKKEQAKNQQNFQTGKFMFEHELDREKFGAQREDKAFSELIGLQQFQYQQERDKVNDEKQSRKEKRAYELEKSKMRMQEGKNDRALWESKLKSGQNMLGSLIGGGNGAVDLGSKVGNVDNSRNLAIMSGATSQGGDPRNMMMMAGGMNQSVPFENKANMIVGSQQSDKGWAQKVSESVGRRAPEQVMQEERERREQQIAQQPVMQQQPRPQQFAPQQQMQRQPRPQYQQPVYRPQRQIDWDEVSPQEAAQYDPEYAKYLAESQSETTYRRGPYKKRRF